MVDIHRAAVLYHRLAGVDTATARAAFAAAESILHTEQMRLAALEAALAQADAFADQHLSCDAGHARYAQVQQQRIAASRRDVAWLERIASEKREALRECIAQERTRLEPVLLHDAEQKRVQAKRAENQQEEDCAFRYTGKRG